MDSGNLKTKAQHYLNALKVKWLQLHETPTVFAYMLNVQVQKFLPGRHYFYAELNPERSSLRRKPQQIDSLQPTFAPQKFNFQKVDPLEVMLTIPFEQAETQMIINKSPLTQYHTLICPEVDKCLVQRLTNYGLRFCVNFLLHIDDKNCRIGYNSPGALASVNHLHFHLVYLTEHLYIDRVKLTELAHGYIYRLTQDMPTQAICWIIQKSDGDAIVQEKVSKLYKLTEWLCAQNMPHNLYMTHERLMVQHHLKGALKIFLFARANYCVIKDLKSFNLGFCEQAGYITVGDSKQLNELTEELILQRIRDETGDVYTAIYEHVQNNL